MVKINCSKCGFEDGHDPNDHPCMNTLLSQFEEARAAIPQDQTEFHQFNIDDLIDAQRKLSKIYVIMDDVVEFHLNELNQAESRHVQAVNKRQSVRSYVNDVRKSVRERLEPLD